MSELHATFYAFESDSTAIGTRIVSTLFLSWRTWEEYTLKTGVVIPKGRERVIIPELCRILHVAIRNRSWTCKGEGKGGGGGKRTFRIPLKHQV